MLSTIVASRFDNYTAVSVLLCTGLVTLTANTEYWQNCCAQQTETEGRARSALSARAPYDPGVVIATHCTNASRSFNEFTGKTRFHVNNGMFLLCL